MKTKNFGLDQEEFSKLCIDLKNGDETMFEKIFLSHFSDCMNYLKNNYKVDHENAYDVSMDTLLDFRKALMSDKVQYGNLRYLFTKMASQKYFKLKKKEAIFDSTDYIPELEEEEVELSDNELITLEKAWNRLGDDCKSLLKKFYYDRIKLKEIAEFIEKSAPATRKQKERCLGVLRNNFKQLVKI